jgi:nucleoside-diphosphate-sugar epimerase
MSKMLAETMCRVFTESSEVSVICLRPPGVWAEKTYAWIQSKRAKRPEFEWDPFWEYGAFIDVRDLSRACIHALTCEVDRFACLLVSSADISTSGSTSRELAEFVMPQVEWRGGAEFEAEPFRSLLKIDNAVSLLGWTPRHLWKSYLDSNS